LLLFLEKSILFPCYPIYTLPPFPMKLSNSLYSRLALATSITLVIGYFVVYAVYQNIETTEVGPGATITTGLMTKIKDNFDNISTRVTTLEWAIAGASVWSKVGSDINYTAGKVGIGTVSPGANLHVAKDQEAAIDWTSILIDNPDVGGNGGVSAIRLMRSNATKWAWVNDLAGNAGDKLTLWGQGAL